MPLPLLLSLPHAGLKVPPSVRDLCRLDADQIAQDGDVDASEIYAIEADVACFVTTDIARAIVDLNRAIDDRSKDGVVKTHTCWDVPVYSTFPSEELIAALLAAHYDPYHRRLTRLAGAGLRLGIDCHTMAATGPPVGPDPGAARPHVCLSNGDGTCPEAWLDDLRRCFEDEFGAHVAVNRPFTGGYIVRSHAAEMPWVQLELSRAPFLDPGAKRDRVRRALTAWVAMLA